MSADKISTHFRQYHAGSEKWRNTPIKFRKSKIDYSVLEFEHPDDALNQKYIDAGAADDHERPLCVAIHDGEICKRPARRGRRYCQEGRSDA